MSVFRPIITGPEGIVRTTWKLTALANVGTRTIEPCSTGTPVRSSTILSGAIIAGAAPTHIGESRTATACECSTGATVTCSWRPTPQLLRAVPSICRNPSRVSSETSTRATQEVPPVTLITSPACTPMRFRSAGARRAMARPTSSTRASATRKASVVTGALEVVSFTRPPRSLRHRLKLRLNLAAETREKLAEALLLGVTKRFGQNLHASPLVAHVGQAHRSEVRVNERVAFTLGRSDGH